MKTKFCNKCKKYLPATPEYFHRDKSKPNGLSSVCKKDRREYESQPKRLKVRAKQARSNRKKNKTKINERSKERYNNDPEFKERRLTQGRKSRNKRHHERKNTDPEYHIKHNLRGRFSGLVKNSVKNKASFVELIGSSYNNLVNHIERQFYPHPETGEKMSWNNYGLKGWHIDHIVPCVSFDLRKIKDQKECFNYINLQPLWAEENLKKGSKLSY